jgi:hypothetical protein
MRSVLDEGRRAVSVSGAIDPLVLLCVGPRNGHSPAPGIQSLSLTRSAIELLHGENHPPAGSLDYGAIEGTLGKI